MQPSYPSPEFPGSFAIPGEPQPASTGIRALAVAGGILALLIGTVISFGMGLVALLGMGVTALIWRARGARPTRRATWIGAVLAVALSFATLLGVGVSLAPGSVIESMQSSMQQASQQPPPPIVERMRQFGPPQDPRVQRRIDALSRSRGYVVWTLVMSLTFGSLFFGLVVGTAAWGCAMLVGYGMRGRWPMPRPAPAPQPATSPVRLPLIVD